MKLIKLVILILLVKSEFEVYSLEEYKMLNISDKSSPTDSKNYRFLDKVLAAGSKVTNYVGDNLLSVTNRVSSILSRYYEGRKKLIQSEMSLMTGAQVHLNELESIVNAMFMEHKVKELAQGQNNTDHNAAGLHFFKGKALIEKSKIFRFLRKMPKGAILHLHNSASVSSEWVVRNISYKPGLLRCTNKDGTNILTFRESATHGCTSSYLSVGEERKQAVDRSTYDIYFEKLVNLYDPNPETVYTSIDKVWTKFQNMFLTMSDALKYIPVYREYHWQMLKEMYEDNIMYAEIRANFQELYDKKGRVHPKEVAVNILINVVRRFREKYPKFLGIKVIYSIHRGAEKSVIEERIKNFQILQSQYPEFIVGFDMVGQEDKGKPLINFIQLLQQPSQTTYFFHAGETNRYGTSTDFNLYDAILLNTKRIGHGYALMKHPLLRRVLKNRNIAIEICPISNQVLHLTADLRNHPGGIFLSEDVPIVISNDDPGFWDAKGLSYDFYYAIMSFASRESGLKLLKSLALNSFQYSAMNDLERKEAITAWQQDWNTFMKDVLRGNVF